jgi:hypothetical protein
MSPDERRLVQRVATVLTGLARETGQPRGVVLRQLADLLTYGPQTGCSACGEPLPPPARTGRPRKRCVRHSGHARKRDANEILGP